MTTLPLYFDYAATTPVDERVIQVMVECLGVSGRFGNPASSSHRYGQQARLAVEQARSQVAGLVGARADEIIWTSGATESNNLALKGLAQGRTGGHVITSRIEHKAVLDTARQLELAGIEVTWLSPDAQGLITEQAVSAALRDDTFLVSLMLVNNELGTLNDVQAIGERVRRHGALLHVDAAQGAGKVPIDLSRWPVDLMSFSAHKVYGPKGIGALYVGKRAAPLLQAQIHGGGHENGLRSGTLATHQIAAMGAAFALAGQVQQQEVARMHRLRERLLEQLADIPGLGLNGSPVQRIPHTLSLTFGGDGIDLQALARTLAFSSTSACNSASSAPSHVLLALGHDERAARQTLRLSLGRYTREEDIDAAAGAIHAALHNVPFWAVAHG
ncbi:MULTISPECIES: cysteine desulfurase family protein [Pseudomonas]|jgi:cysteine desulfurase|uniref:cysteine desulfurase n=2 Tax=Pseudomonas TaxID=286 RepID=A0A9X8EPY1_PSEPU|nr:MULTISPECIES: aminotransferase class V-fold PLP-dependent enzyme [Pseudomonas]OOW02760.1 IscS subfamily cysteine desulfurase [Pseudomonas sp. MF6396]PPS59627.1 aminotransferase class V-fold PLP-dependent enzyme [Pseudomonas sp. BRM28]QVL20902.1 aminotransferase class V-fold PLP-dependent enzyme [Pseudomonas qingdaonensis]ROQ56137.1 cysteine desulfurase [Pseudomonas putida]UVL53099.1 aminotransferase class V-fold PLP-dependent enzyme [Pseudomonas sp. B21-036]